MTIAGGDYQRLTALRRLALFAGVVVLVLCFLEVVRLIVTIVPAWESYRVDWDNLAAATQAANPYDVPGYRWSPVAAWVLVPIVALGFPIFAAAHFAVLPLIRDWRVVTLLLLTPPFWADVLYGNIVTFAFVAAWLALAGSRWATWAFFALTVMVPRPLMLPVLVWLLWRRPETRVAFAVIFGVHTVLVLASGLGADWIARLVESSSELEKLRWWSPSTYIGAWWIPIGTALAVWLTWRGRLGFASLAIQPYLFADYLMFGFLELQRPQPLTTPRPPGAFRN